jgi:hypothetical protein
MTPLKRPVAGHQHLDGIESPGPGLRLRAGSPNGIRPTVARTMSTGYRYSNHQKGTK